MRVVITGGLGFIGSEFVSVFHEKHPNYEIVIVDKYGYASNKANILYRKNLVEANIQIVNADISDYDSLAKNVFDKQIDSVFNFAAESHNDRANLRPLDAVATNFTGVANLLELSKLNKVRKFVQISTDEVYGSITNGIFSETSPLLPNQPYSAAKAGGELLVRAYNKTYGLDTLVTRGANTFGPYQHPEKLLPLSIIHSIRGLPVPVYGSGKQVREWMPVRFHAEMIYEMYISSPPVSVVNIGTGVELENIAILQMVAAQLKNYNIPMKFQFVGDRPGHDFRYSMDHYRMNCYSSKPGYAIRAFESDLNNTVDWYVNAESWWGPTFDSPEFQTYHKKLMENLRDN